MHVDFKAILDKIINELVPLTQNSVQEGNKIFGAIILSKKDYSTIVVDTNNETSNPIFHGEISTINNYFKNVNHTKPNECLFISSHEPCSMCLSAITWSGFDNFYYLFPFQDTENKFNIPHDLNILKEVFNIKDGKYNKTNHYWKSFSILNEIQNTSPSLKYELINKYKEISEKYENLSQIYQKSKKNNKIPLN